MILETLASYGVRTRAEMLNAAQIIAFGYSTLDALGDANATEISAPMRLRCRSCANSLNRSAQQSEKTLAKRMAADLPDAEVVAEAGAEPLDDHSEPQLQEAIQQARAKIDDHRARTSAASRPVAAPQPRPPSQQERNKQLWGNAMMDALAKLGMPVHPVTPQIRAT